MRLRDLFQRRLFPPLVLVRSRCADNYEEKGFFFSSSCLSGGRASEVEAVRVRFEIPTESVVETMLRHYSKLYTAVLGSIEATICK